MNSYNTTTPNFDNLLIQALTNKLQLNPSTNPQQQSLEDLLFNTLPFSDSDSDNNDLGSGSKSQLVKEESRVEKHIIRTIFTGNIDSLKPNSGQAVSIGEHQICIGFHDDDDESYRVWEWHGHVILFDEEYGYNPEYIYGNYFERVNNNNNDDVKVIKKKKEKGEEVIEKVGNLGLRELIESSGESDNAGRILRRNMNAGGS